MSASTCKDCGAKVLHVQSPEGRPLDVETEWTVVVVIRPGEERAERYQRGYPPHACPVRRARLEAKEAAK